MGQPLPPSIKLRNTILILLLLIAFALRLYRLDHQEIWGDEAHSAYLSKLPLSSAASPRMETNPPLYHLILWFWVKLTGSSVFALRFLSLVLGVLTVPLVYGLARLAFGELVGLLATLLCAISPFQIYYSQEARMYALATFFTTLSMFLLARIVSGESSSHSRFNSARPGSPDPGQKRGLGQPMGDRLPWTLLLGCSSSPPPAHSPCTTGSSMMPTPRANTSSRWTTCGITPSKAICFS